MAANEDEATQTPAMTELAQAIVFQLMKPGTLRGLEVVGSNTLADWVKMLIAAAIPLGVTLIEPFARGIAEGENLAAPAMARLNALAINDLLGTNISESTMAGPGAGRKVAGDIAIGDAILRSFATAGGAIQPDDAPAKKYLSLMVGYSMEGWLEGWMFQAVTQLFSLGQVNLDKFAELDDILANALGLGRMSSRIIRPYVRTLVETPLQWKVNKTYTPTLLSAAEAARQFFRGRWTREQVNEELGRQGYSTDRIEALLNGQRKTVSASDILYLQRDGGMPRATAELMLKEMGYDAETIVLLFAAEDARRYRAMLEQTANVAGAAYIDGHMTSAELQAYLSEIYPQPEERALFMSLLEAKRIAGRKRLSKADVEDAVKRNILSMIDYRRWAEAEGYDADSIMTLELLLAAEIGDAAEQARRRAEIERQREEAEKKRKEEAEKRRLELEARRAASIPPLADLKKAVIRGVVPIDRYSAQLRALEYPAADISFLVQLLQEDRDAQLEKEEQAAALALLGPQRDLSIGDLTRAVVAELLSPAELMARARDAGYDADEAALLGALAAQQRDDAREAKRRREEAAAAAAKRGLSLAQAERAVLHGIWTLGDYGGWLKSAGFDDFTISILTALLRTTMETQTRAVARAAAIADDVKTRNISLAQIEQAVIRGLRPIDEYRRVLQEGRYSDVDQQLLIDLLTSKILDAGAADAARATIAAASKNRRVSLAQIERAVQLGTVSLDAYRAWLADVGYTGIDAEILIDATVSDLRRVRADEELHTALLDKVGARAGDVVELERQVIAGDESPAAYVALLRALRVADADVDRLVARLQLLAADDADARALAEIADNTLTTRGLSMAQWAEAVRAQLRTLDDYAAFLTTQGFDAADVQILTTLLAGDLDRAAAKQPRGGGQ